jgi:glycosyltransferase involved in cell wall biosynthesis
MTLPQSTHRLHFFQTANTFYVADLEKSRTKKLSRCAWEFLSLYPEHPLEEVRESLLAQYATEEIEAAMEELEALHQEGLLLDSDDWSAGWKAVQASKRPRLFIPQPVELWFREVSQLTAGTNMALHQMVNHLSQWVDIHFAGQQFRQLAEGIFEIPLSREEALSVPWTLEPEGYLGIMALHLDSRPGEMLPFFQRVDLPILLQIHAPRGHGGEEINSILRYYAAMRPFDGFTVPSQSVIDFYQRFVLDTDCFFVLPNGFEAELFQPMDKMEAKQSIAEIATDPRITQQPVVGYLSRFQPEKGASLFLKVAQRMPNVLFLIGGQTLGRYATHPLPQNIAYAGFLPREKLPVLYNAFDIYCFPTLSGEETFGLTLLEAMACGVPAVIPNWDGMPEVMRDGGIAVEANTFPNDIGSFAASVSPEALARGIRRLLDDEGLRVELGKKARERALNFSWEATAKRILSIFEELHRRKQFYHQNPYFSRFVSKLNVAEGMVQSEAVLLNVTDRWENPLMESGYPQTLKEGLALSLLRRHTPHEVEAVLWHLCDDREEVEQVLERVQGFIEAAT